MTAASNKIKDTLKYNKIKKEHQGCNTASTHAQPTIQTKTTIPVPQPTWARRPHLVSPAPKHSHHHRTHHPIHSKPSHQGASTSRLARPRIQLATSVFREVRDMLRAVKVSTSRIIDISFPARGTIALLVHLAYAPSLKKLMRQEGVKTADDFNLLDAKVVGDPRHAAKPDEEKRALARHFYVERIKATCAAQRHRPHLAISIARFFCFEQERDLQLPEIVFRDILAAHKTKSTHQNSDDMAIDPPATTTSTPAPTSTSKPTDQQ